MTKLQTQPDKATVRPWTLLHPDQIRGAEGIFIADCATNSRGTRQDIDAANAALIVQAVNEHDALEALRQHILSMADDAYLVGHPEWVAIVAEAKGVQS